MSGTSMVVLIVLIAVIGRVIQARYQRRDPDATFNPDTAATSRLHDEVRQLRERIQVLERVITDNHSSVDLDREIERLRDR